MKKLFYHWTGCPCTEAYSCSTEDFEDMQPLRGWEGNLAIEDYYSIEEIKNMLLSGESEIWIKNICPRCLGEGYDIYFLVESD